MADIKQDAHKSYDALESSDARILGARMGVETMLYYYYTALVGKVKDPKQYMATRIPVMIDISDEQATYVGANISSNNAVMDGLSTSIKLLRTIQESDKLDHETLALVINILGQMHLNCEDALNTFIDTDIKANIIEEEVEEVN